MSEEIKFDKAELVGIVKSSVEEKADKTEIKSLADKLDAIEIPSVEGFVKSEDLAAANEKVAELTEKLESLETTVKSAPAIINKGSNSMDFSLDSSVIKADTKIDFSDMIAKQFVGTGSSQIAGSTTGAQRVFYGMEQKNPFRMVSTMMPTTSGAVNLPSVSGIAASNESATPLASLGSTSTTGNLASSQVIPQNWAARAVFSDQSLEDLPSLDQMVAALMAQEIAVAEATDMVTQLNAATVEEVNTGVATGLPSSIRPWASLVADLSTAYKANAKFVMSREALQNLRGLTQSSGGDLVIDPSDGMFKLWGYDIVINDHLDAGSTGGENPVYFGDFRQGTIIVSRKEMQVGRHEDTIPGAVYYYGNMRSRGVVWDASAIRRFNVAT